MSAIKHALQRSWRALLAYLLFTAWGLGCMVVSVLLILGEHAFSAVTEMNVLLAVAGIVVAGLIGHVVGNVLGLLRLRVWVMCVLALAFLIGATLSSAALGPWAGFLVVAGIAAAGGFLAVGSSEIFASWVPLTYAVGAAVLWMNTHGKVSVWLTGAKFAVWDAITFGFLSGAVVLFLVFLLQRHALALTLWQEAARPGGARRDLDIHARAGKGSVGCLVGLCGIVLVATAILSPFLFRTERVEAGTRTTSTTQTGVTEGACVPSSGSYGANDSYRSSGGGSTGAYAQPTEGTSCGGESVGGHSVGGHSVGGHSVGGHSVGGHSVGGSSVGGSSVGGSSVGGHSVGGTSVGGTSVGGSSVGGKSIGGESVGGKSVGGESVGGKSVGGESTGGTTTGATTTGATTTGGTAGGSTGSSTGEPGPGPSPGTGGNISKPDLAHAKEKSIDAAKLGLIVMRWLVVLLGLLLVLAIFFRPLRRAILLRHLEHPLWTTTPTRRVQNLWLRAIIALDDAGISARPDEAPVRLAQRAIDELGKQHGSVPGGLEQAADIVERVEYAGRGLGADEEAKMRNAVLALVSYVNRNTGVGRKVAQGWSSIPFA